MANYSSEPRPPYISIVFTFLFGLAHLALTGMALYNYWNPIYKFPSEITIVFAAINGTMGLSCLVGLCTGSSCLLAPAYGVYFAITFTGFIGSIYTGLLYIWPTSFLSIPALSGQERQLILEEPDKLRDFQSQVGLCSLILTISFLAMAIPEITLKRTIDYFREMDDNDDYMA